MQSSVLENTRHCQNTWDLCNDSSSTWASRNKNCKRKAEFGTATVNKIPFDMRLYWEKAKATVDISWTLLPWSWQSGALPWSPAWSCRSCPTGQCWSHSQVVSWPPPPCCLVQNRVLGVKDVDVFPTLTGFIITLQWPFLKDEQFFNFTSCVSFIYPSPAC